MGQGQDRRWENLIGVNKAPPFFGAGLPPPADPATKESVDPRPWDRIHLLIEGNADASPKHARSRGIVQVGMDHSCQGPAVRRGKSRAGVGVVPYKLLYVKEAKPRSTSQKEAGWSKTAGHFDVADAQVRVVAPKILIRMIPRLVNWVSPG